MILVTGGTGFLGSYIIKLLVEKGYRVRAIRRSSKLPTWMDESVFKNVEWVEGDVLDVVALEEAMEGVEAVIHSAAVVSFLKKERKTMYQVNIDGTTNVVNVMLEKNINRLVYISSVAALGRTAGGGHVNEERKWEDSKINTHYSITKHKAEMEVWRGISEGLNAVILNPSTILGFGDWTTGSCAIFKNIQKGISWFTPGINGFVDVEDVAKATMQILESEITEQRFIVNGHTWPFKKLQETIAENFGKKKPTRAANPFLLGIAWRIEKIKSLLTGQKPLLTKESAKVACSQTWFENEKLLNALPGFTYRPLEETIKKACDQYKQIAS
ncbi:MAG TPA: SDR family NAD(P)-dependent oxidoreductase [Chitinophagaceae bacterium]|nr:SDR family NAD(P)-dependent oxidoreductase [Chitinophagaceae bacterium]HND95460.1 SDR family NAD(P)-dependent oxidoreductase [Chitinophagaceae bacterium]HNJ56326.1 SDR family NAD(P)-dependent oxidoreductase [Chitinophagaceae bacterium]HNL59331.1 SDR family NAD(P)-dependent oxidoreductase [Chitinophagaceae bacterium]HNO54243.1 SDR family NAD(P)-dependent oxidoreductase [Chitinophagaceae bacterium]